MRREGAPANERGVLLKSHTTSFLVAMRSIGLQTANMAAAVVDYAPECGTFMELALADSKAGEVTPFRDQAREAAFFLALHLLDRIALRHLGFADRELYMNPLLTALQATIQAYNCDLAMRRYKLVMAALASSLPRNANGSRALSFGNWARRSLPTMVSGIALR
jgi:hypothetical protein